MNYLRWYRSVLSLPVMNEVTLKLIEPAGKAFTGCILPERERPPMCCWPARLYWQQVFRAVVSGMYRR